ncbi:DUF896 domain-containing protein [Conchiformibius steedae DSM 2580]|uniref:DUF896 domain-containing protein n=1 Tax=Conchiformibius steedae DSM 2580 TaxID=1121352 RepID=A0AAE9HS45_9NEIS|nr:DUF896 domain-containing protein [Conchiformibius steedae]QMT33910.1 DUF896 domain-containing protein [Conchiformibius steedae]URD66679.1 DUF896 domain-containing protein [Conchiformibius steedae DSM 2580]
MRIAELDRINQLAQKAKTTPLSTAEQHEREQLRQSYLAQIRAQFRGTLSVLTVIDSEGNDVTPAKLRYAQANNLI